MAREDTYANSDEPLPEPTVIEGEECPLCRQKSLTLMELEREIPYFGRVRLYSMSCQNPSCRFSTSDVDVLEQNEPSKYTLRVSSEDDLNARVVKSSTATIRIGRLGSIEPITRSPGYVSTVEGVLKRFERQVRFMFETAEDTHQKRKAKAILKKLQRVLTGQEEIDITIEDPNGNSAIISPRALRKPLSGRTSRQEDTESSETHMHTKE